MKSAHNFHAMLLQNMCFTSHAPIASEWYLEWLGNIVFCKGHYMNHISLKKGQVLNIYVVAHCTGRVSASTRLNQLFLGDRKMELVACV